MEKPDVDYIEGLSPAISIDQKTTSKTAFYGRYGDGDYDYLRLLYARIGIPALPVSADGGPGSRRVDQIVDRVMELPERSKRFRSLRRWCAAEKASTSKNLTQRAGPANRVRVDGLIYDLSESIKLEKNKKHTIEIVVDRLVMKEEIRSRLADSIETASSLSGGLILVSVQDGKELTFRRTMPVGTWDQRRGIDAADVFFSIIPSARVPKCMGLGVFMKIDPDRILPDRRLSINKRRTEGSGWAMEGNSIASMYLNGLARHYDFFTGYTDCRASDRIVDILLYGTRGEKIDLVRGTRKRLQCLFGGI